MPINEIDAADVELDRRLKNSPGYRNLQRVQGIGPVLAAVFVVEIGDVRRFGTPGQLACWAGLTPAITRATAACAVATPARKATLWPARAAIEAIQRTCEPQVQPGQAQRARPAREDRPQHRQGRRGAPHARRRVLRPARRHARLLDPTAAHNDAA
jgi:hypothetical protein